VAFYQKINLFNRVIFAYLGGLSLFITAIIAYFSTLPQEKISVVSAVASNLILFSVIIGFLLLAWRNRINVYESFIEGAKDGFQVAVGIIPYLVAILVAVGVFRTSGAMDYLIQGLQWTAAAAGFNTDFVPAMPTALMKPLSGSGARGMMLDTMKTYGADSFAGRLSAIVQGSTETTFYVLAVYFGSVSIRKTRYALTCGLIADAAGIIAAILLAYLFFH
jgi:spore maturation protein SpmB